MIKGLKPNSKNMMAALQKGFPTATDLADYLVTNQNIPFRDAHQITGKIVLLGVLSNFVQSPAAAAAAGATVPGAVIGEYFDNIIKTLNQPIKFFL